MGGVCRARNCFRSKDKCPDLPFFTFPKNPISARKWITNIGDPELLKRPPSALKNNVVCALHFEEKCFVNKKKRTLARNAVPTLFNIPPLKSQESPQNAKHSQSERTDVPGTVPGAVFSCEVETLDHWHRQIDAVTEQLLSLLPENSSHTPQLEPQTEKKCVDAYTQYENESDDHEFVERLNDLNKETNVESSDVVPKVQLLCRLCSKLIHRECVIPVFSYDAEKIRLEDMINSIMPAKVAQDDGLPQQICNLCIRKLTFCYDVRSEFLASDKRLRELLGVATTKKPKDTHGTKENVEETCALPEVPSSEAIIPPAEDTTKVQPNENEPSSIEPETKETTTTQAETLKRGPRKRKKVAGPLKNKNPRKNDDKTPKLLKSGPRGKKTAAEESDFENDSNYEIHWYDEAYEDSVSEDVGTSDSILNNKKMLMTRAKRPRKSETVKFMTGPDAEEETKSIQKNITILNNKKLNERKVNVGQVNKSKVNERRVNDSQLTESKVTESELTDHKVNEIEVIDSKVNGSNITDSKVNVRKVTDSKVNEIDVTDSKVNESKVVDSKVNDSKVMNSKVNETKVTDSEVNETKVMDSEVIETKVMDSKVSEAKVTDSKVNENKVIDSKVNEDKVIDNKINENKVTDRKVHESKVTDRKVHESKVTDRKMHESKVTDRKMHESKVTDRKVHESKVTDRKVHESKVTDRKVHESKMTDSKVHESKVTDSKAPESKMNDGKVNESKANDTKMNESKVNESKVNESKVIGSKVTGSKANEDKVNESKVNTSITASITGNYPVAKEGTLLSSVPARQKIGSGSVKVRLMTERQKLLKLKSKAQNKLIKQASKKKALPAKNTCSECNKSFSSKWKLDRHILMHSMFECAVCSTSFNTAEDLSNHSRENCLSKLKAVKDAAAKSHECEVCKRTFKTHQRLLIHSKTHTAAIPYTCSVCPKEFPTRIRLKQHLKSHKPEKSFKCLICNESFKNNKALIRHRAQHSESCLPLKCEACGAFFTSVKEYEKHKEGHASNILNIHVNGASTAEMNSDVRTVDKEGSGSAGYIETSNVVTAVQEAELAKTMKEDGVMKVKVPHLEKNLIITSSDQFVCDVCDCKFSSKHFQEEHKKMQHLLPTKGSVPMATSSVESTADLPQAPERGKLYFCDQCGEGYERKRSLALHRFSHTTSHRCPHCHQSFSSEDSLTRHLENCVEVKEETTTGRNH